MQGTLQDMECHAGQEPVRMHQGVNSKAHHHPCSDGNEAIDLGPAQCPGWTDPDRLQAYIAKDTPLSILTLSQ